MYGPQFAEFRAPGGAPLPHVVSSQFTWWRRLSLPSPSLVVCPTFPSVPGPHPLCLPLFHCALPFFGRWNFETAPICACPTEEELHLEEEGQHGVSCYSCMALCLPLWCGWKVYPWPYYYLLPFPIPPGLDSLVALIHIIIYLSYKIIFSHLSL